MRILMLSHGYPPTISGVSLVVQKISRALARKGHQVRVLTASERGREYRALDQQVELLRVRSLHNPFWLEGPLPFPSPAALRQALLEFQPDLIHTHENVILSNLLLQARGHLTIPIVSSCYFLPRYVTHYLRWGQQVDRWIERFTLRYALNNLNRFDHVIFSTRTQQEFFLRGGLKTPSSVISNGVDNLRYYPPNGKGEPAGQRYRLPPHPRILVVGRLMKDKKLDLLIEALERVIRERAAYLVIVGRGGERKQLERRIERLNLQRYVHFAGFVPEADLPAVYRACDLFAIVSNVEVQSIPTLQAAVTGLPIVAVNAAALPELVRHGENGCLVPPDDPESLSRAILDLLDNPPLAARMGRASQEIGKAHADSATFDAYERFYCSVIAGQRVEL